MIKYQFFPRNQEVPNQLRDIIKCFEKVNASKKSNTLHLKSNEMLERLRPYLQELKYFVETGKSANNQIIMPVLFGENNQVDKYFVPDAVSEDRKIVIEVEAGRAVINNQFLLDIFKACMMINVEYLVIAVLNEYTINVESNPKTSHDFQTVKTFLETLYVSNRLILPLKGILLIGY